MKKIADGNLCFSGGSEGTNEAIANQIKCQLDKFCPRLPNNGLAYSITWSIEVGNKFGYDEDGILIKEEFK